MKKFVTLLILSILMLQFGTINIFAQKVVNGLEIDKIVIEYDKNHITWDVDSLSNEQIKSLLSSHDETVVFKSGGNLTEGQMTVFLGTKPTITHPSDLNKAIKRGLRFEVELFGSFYDGWYKELSGSTDKNNGKLELENSFGAKIALIYQFKNIFLGGGVGLNAGHLFWKPEKGESTYTDMYGLPLFVRAGIAEAFSENVCGFFNADLGINVGLEKQKTAFMCDLNAGIYYGSAKIALGLNFFKPDEKKFFGDNLVGDYNCGVSLIFGFRI